MARYLWAAVAGGLFVAGIVAGYLLFVNTFSVMRAQQQQQNPQLVMQGLRQDPQAMRQLMDDPEFQRQMLAQMQANPQIGQGMMNEMVADPQLRQQMFEQMQRNPEAMRQWVNNTQFQQDWVYPHMMQDWRMGTGMGPGMMGGPMMRYGVDAASSPAVQTSNVEITQNAWSPRSAEPYRPLHAGVANGTAVTWTNRDDVVHTVTDVDSRFDSKLINPGQSWQHTFDAAGRYDYYCTIHPWMRGAVTVT